MSPPKGVWKPRKIDNPDYFEDLQPFRMTPVRALGLELWSMTSDIYFDNFIITSHKEVADRWASDSWGLKKLVASANEVSVIEGAALLHTLTFTLCVCSIPQGCQSRLQMFTAFALRSLVFPSPFSRAFLLN